MRRLPAFMNHSVQETVQQQQPINRLFFKFIFKAILILLYISEFIGGRISKIHFSSIPYLFDF